MQRLSLLLHYVWKNASTQPIDKEEKGSGRLGGEGGWGGGVEVQIRTKETDLNTHARGSFRDETFKVLIIYIIIYIY